MFFSGEGRAKENWGFPIHGPIGLGSQKNRWYYLYKVLAKNNVWKRALETSGISQ